jgi:chromate transporter
VADLGASLGEQPLDVAVGRAEAQVPAHCEHDDVGREAEAAKAKQPAVQALFYGVAPAVMAIVALAAAKLARLTNRADRRLWAISLAIGAVTAATGAEVALLFVAAGLLMVALDAPPRPLARLRACLPHRPGQTSAHAWPALLAATPTLLSLGASTSTLVALGLFFAKAGASIFGSGLAIVPFLREGVVAQHHWLDQRQFLDAVAMGLLTPARW